MGGALCAQLQSQAGSPVMIGRPGRTIVTAKGELLRALAEIGGSSARTAATFDHGSMALRSPRGPPVRPIADGRDEEP
jgi:hypothetical protein